MDYVERVSENMQLFAPVDVLTGRDFLYEYDPEVNVNQVQFLQISPLMWILIFFLRNLQSKLNWIVQYRAFQSNTGFVYYFSFHFYTIRVVWLLHKCIWFSKFIQMFSLARISSWMCQLLKILIIIHNKNVNGVS